MGKPVYLNGLKVSGGGGTGGHTIIDENGNSMTARAGLQFVGGANVSDDGTNNKTIVDLASAGGIDGVFVDTDNVIVPETSYSGSLSYTATEDCVVFVNILATSSGSGWVYIDNKVVGRTYFVGTAIINGAYYLLKKGQTLTAYSQTYSGIDITYAVYGIQTGTTHSKFQPVIYSTEEREIGVWKNGKPLYAKTMEMPLTSLNNSSWTSIAWTDEPLNIEELVDSVIHQIVPNLNTILRFYIENGHIVGASNITAQSACWATFYYTKTTDTAGSGSWTPQGVPTHHYSTDEQIIGTFLGETLYQRTFDLGSDLLVSTSSWTALGITLDADKIIETKTTSTSGSFQGNILVYNDNGTWKGQTPRNGNDASYVRYLTIAYTKSS